MKDYYALLGIGQKATKAEIKKNYRLLATKYHPDKNSEPSASSTFIAITEAYDVLSSRKSRAAYDLKIWEKLKRKKVADDSFTTIVPPRESTRARRNKAQHKRSINYHDAIGPVKKSLLLILECLYIISRYIFHIIGITLIAVILSSALPQTLSGFNSSIATGLSISGLIVFLVWAFYMIAINVFTEIKKDIVIFSIYYKITHRRAILFTLSVFIVVLILYLSFLKSF